MRKTRYTEEQMVNILREADRTSIPEAAKKHGVSDQTIYNWRQHFGGLEAADVIELSVERAAIIGATGEFVSPVGYVVVHEPGTVRRWTHRVRLLDQGKLQLLAQRRQAILDGDIPPRVAANLGTCRRCAFATECGSTRNR